MVKTKKLLVVGMPFSIHVARWLDNLKNTEWEVHFFSSFPYSAPHPKMSGIIFHDFFYNYKSENNKNNEYRDFANRALVLKNSFINKWVGKAYRFLKFQKDQQEYLRLLIDKIQPDIIHSMESQHGGYLVAGVYKGLKDNTGKPLWVHTTYGIDLDYFMHFSDQKQKLKAMFSGIDFYIAEGSRDIQYARELGFKKKSYIFPCVGGGYFLDEFVDRNNAKPSQRKRIVIKGYQDSVRRGLVALRAIVKCKDLLSGYEVFVYSCAVEVEDYIYYINSKEGMDIRIFKPTKYEGWLKLLSEARVSITNNLSDGIPSSFFESMLMGAFPIQSESSCANDWIEHGKTGFFIPPEDPDIIEKSIREALTNDELVDKAATLNYEKVASNLEFHKVREEILGMYTEVLESTSTVSAGSGAADPASGGNQPSGEDN